MERGLVTVGSTGLVGGEGGVRWKESQKKTLSNFGISQRYEERKRITQERQKICNEIDMDFKSTVLRDAPEGHPKNIIYNVKSCRTPFNDSAEGIAAAAPLLQKERAAKRNQV